jgi:DNA primase
MPTISKEKIEELRAKVDIVDLIGRHVDLRRAGKQFKGLCPFHAERTPSFYVDPARHAYKCFGCGEWGDAIDFVEKVEGKSFGEAVRTLAGRYGVLLPDRDDREARREEARQVERDDAYRITELAAKVYRQILVERPEGESARAYQHERGVAEATAETFQLGYAPDASEAGWDALTRELTRARLPLQLAETLGLVSRSERTGSHFDRFRGRLMFPIVQPGGAIVGFSGRILPRFAQAADGDKAPKYLNSPDSLLFHKGKLLFGLHQARQSIRERGRAILVEGNLDVVTMHQRGHTETVAPLGTAATPAQCELLARFARTVVLCFDGDRAGAKAARDAIPMMLAAEIEPRIVALADGEDPDSVAAERIAALLERPGAALEWLMRRMASAGAGETPESRARALEALIPLIRQVRWPAARRDYADLAANLLGIPAGRVWAGIEGKRTDTRSQTQAAVPNSAPMRPAPLPTGETVLTALVVDRPQISTLARRSGVLDFVTDPRLAPILARVMEATFQGETQPAEGELLALVDPAVHALLHEHVFGGRFIDIEDAEAVLADGLMRCRRERLEREVVALDSASATARERGDESTLRELQRRKIEIRKQQAELRRAQLSH